ncbi:MAG: glutamine-hydrolyzing GMP synthase [SAR324 cluster bacterium]|nr:glutamine-hydrolyzing GMP synthase [SAR324 cluster bacterium]MBL7035391.1 glutamine-hydrolyzing GMP synthase [SAR324 cluster bacterium]
MQDFIAVLDFGSQYAHLIAKRIRHLGAYTKIFSPSTKETTLAQAKGIVLSGGPASVYSPNIPAFNTKILNLNLPILGLCYGHQLIASEFGGKISNTGKGEFGKAKLTAVADFPLWENVSFPNQVWMSHQDSVTECPPDFKITGVTEAGSVTAMQHLKRQIYSLQFHPEVNDSEEGEKMLLNFVKCCSVNSSWSMEKFIDETTVRLRQEVAERKVLMFISGGVDSSVAYALLAKALGEDQMLGLYINNGFMRKDESTEIMERYQQLGFSGIKSRDYSSIFLEAVADQIDPQIKRHKIGAAFIQMRDKFLSEFDLQTEDWLLGQGTLYPDIIESGGTEHAEVIKSHHNRVQEVLDLLAAGKVVEPLKDLYKDEVRKVGSLLGLPDSIVWRHPFPGPGLAVNVLCARGDEQFPELAKTAVEVRKCLQDRACDSIILPVRSVGVQGDQRTYTSPVALMNAPRDWHWLEKEATRLTNEVRNVNRVVLQLGSKSKDLFAPFQIRSAFCTKARLNLLREADFLVTQMLQTNALMQEIFQLLVILLPISKSGMEDSLVLRPVISEDVMTAQFARIDWNLLDPLLESLLELAGIETVFYDITHKPPGTFGWE